MALNPNKTSDLTLEQRTFYDRNLLSRLLPNLCYTLFGQVRPMPTKAGQTVSYRKFSSLAVPSAALTEGTTPDGRALAMSEVTVTMEQWGDFVTITDILDLTAIDPVLVETGELLGEQAALLIDNKVRDVMGAGTNVQYASTATSRVTVAAGMKLVAAEILEAVRTMHTNKVKKVTSVMNSSTGVGSLPVAAGYVGIIGPKTLFDLKADSAFIPVHKYPSQQGLLPFEVGALDEVRFVMTQEDLKFTGAGAAGIDVYGTLILGQDAYGVVSPVGVQNIIKGFGEGDDPLNQRMTSGWKAYFKAVILNQLAILRIEHAVS